MATKTKETHTDAKKHTSSAIVQHVQKDIKPFQAFFTKFNNDWSMNLSAALAYNLLMAMFPIAIAILSILGFFLGTLDPNAKSSLISNIQHVLPSQVSPDIINQIEQQLSKNAGVFAFIAVILALFNGSRLFILIEGIFGIIYHVRQRKVIQQNLMAFGMLLLFVILIPIMTFAAALPALVLSILPGGGILGILGGILGGLIASFLLFMAIYVVVPNQHISFRNSLWGSIVAAVALQIYLQLFPLYVSHFLNSYAGPISLVILLVFFYYFAVILLLGAEVNAFFAEKVQATPVDLVTMVHITTSHLPKSKEEKEVQAAASHKEAPTGSVAEKTGIEDTSSSGKSSHDTAGQMASLTNATSTTKAPILTETKVVKEPAKSASKAAVVVEAVAGTGLAFLLEWFRLRRKKPQ
ncbi:MAG TPA: YihY/virulence factor BrkB family protein [Ktedonobacteraceae bacterium]|nr:YihY/virulence factor BrkB family protein [Ktedonobacteraceae bacterium]